MALEGIRVLDLSRLLPGPYCTLLLADLGADVVKVEDPGGGDYLRHLPPSAGELSALFHALNRGKRSVAVDLKSREGVDVFLKLLAKADVVVESFRAGAMERLGLGWKTIEQIAPRVVLCSVGGYPASGPLAARAGHDLNYLARSGLLGYGGEPEGGPPAMPGGQMADVGGALMAAVGILAALQERQRTGRGRKVEVSLYESAFAFLHMHLGGRLAMGEAGAPLSRGDTLNGGVACYRVYRTKDGRWLSVAALEPKFWVALCTALGREDLANEGWATGEEGRKVRAEMERIVAERTLAEWEQFLADKDLCCEPVREGDEVLSDPAFPPDFVFSVRDPHEQRDVQHLRTPLRLGPRAAGPAPALGEHTDALLAEAGVSAAEIAVLKQRGVLG
ncbi:MAG TPA: CaiB/BaiF CoA-transferase family protein [Myxococcales bacterium]|jgi:crotonobetainyl-CoA:carnitine CoA-transferase CaiB-like acyl-CoA transferase